MWKGVCGDESCRQVLLFSEEELFVTCYVCGQTRSSDALKDRGRFDPALDPYNCIIHSLASKLNIPQRAPDLVKVAGFSHYHHKLISPLLSTFGVDRRTGKAIALKQITGNPKPASSAQHHVVNLQSSAFSDDAGLGPSKRPNKPIKKPDDAVTGEIYIVPTTQCRTEVAYSSPSSHGVLQSDGLNHRKNSYKSSTCMERSLHICLKMIKIQELAKKMEKSFIEYCFTLKVTELDGILMAHDSPGTFPFRVFLDCSVFGNWTFQIESRHLGVSGFGKDSASFEYLEQTLKVLLPFNNNVENLVPLHVDGDGHCLVHAISRAVVGRELFWHPLRVGLKQHFIVNLEKYKSLLGSFINNSEWPTIIDECEPEYRPGDGSMIGLRNIHVFGLSNLLRRPIILLDSMAGMKASADYAAVFLPGLNPPMTCSNKDGKPNPPLCLAWSSAARNHYIPLVPIKELPCPKLPRSFLPKVWGFPQDLLDTYMKFDDQGCVVIGSECDVPIPDLSKLTTAIDELFCTKNGVPPGIVADLFHYQYSTKLASNPKLDVVVDAAAACLKERRLLRCIACWSINVVPIASQWFRPGGHLYMHAKKLTGGYLRENFTYSFRAYNVTCIYDSRVDALIIEDYNAADPCQFCNEPNKLRVIRRDGTTVHQDGDRTNIPINDNENGCPCGFKHWWGGNYHETRPLSIPIVLDWNGIVKKDNIEWFRHENNRNLNSNVYAIALLMIHKHFPGDMDNDELQETIAAQIIDQTKDIRSFEVDSKDQGDSGDPSGDMYMWSANFDHPGCSSDASYDMAGSSKASHFRDDFDHYHKDLMSMCSTNLYEASRKRPGDLDYVDAPSPKSSHLDDRSSPKPSTSRLSPKYS